MEANHAAPSLTFSSGAAAAAALVPTDMREYDHLYEDTGAQGVQQCPAAAKRQCTAPPAEVDAIIDGKGEADEAEVFSKERIRTIATEEAENVVEGCSISIDV